MKRAIAVLVFTFFSAGLFANAGGLYSEKLYGQLSQYEGKDPLYLLVEDAASFDKVEKLISGAPKSEILGQDPKLPAPDTDEFVYVFVFLGAKDRTGSSLEFGDTSIMHGLIPSADSLSVPVTISTISSGSLSGKSIAPSPWGMLTLKKSEISEHILRRKRVVFRLTLIRDHFAGVNNDFLKKLK